MDLHTLVRTSLKIAVFGFDEDHCTDSARGIAYFVGREIAQRNYILYTDGLGGVMEAACRGAADARGISIGIIPSDDPRQANPYCSLVIPAGCVSPSILANAVDAALILDESLETYKEIVLLHNLKKPVVVLSCSAWTTAEITENRIEEDKIKPPILSAPDHRSALDLIEAYCLRR